jgi:hypothetical protein
MSHALKHPARLLVENVRIEKQICHLSNSQTETQTRPGSPAKQKQSTPPVCVPDLRGLAHDEPEERLTEYRMLAIEILLQAFHDINLTDNYEVEGNKRTAERARNSAITFFNSAWFREICNALGYPHDSAKKAAFK